jgi:hypothetical protein
MERHGGRLKECAMDEIQTIGQPDGIDGGHFHILCPAAGYSRPDKAVVPALGIMTADTVLTGMAGHQRSPGDSLTHMNPFYPAANLHDLPGKLMT